MIDNMEWFNYNLENEITFGFARFNDGEIGISQTYNGSSRDQYVDETLRAALRSALEHKQENYYIGVPCYIYPMWSSLAKEIAGEDYVHLQKLLLLQTETGSILLIHFLKSWAIEDLFGLRR